MEYKRYIVTTTRTVEVTSVITTFSEEEAVKLAKVDPRPFETDTKKIVVNKVEVCN
tara:strand:+ start:165 stop:332 length:168 start_codon:yes stop_codon:yes gene_type:complete